MNVVSQRRPAKKQHEYALLTALDRLYFAVRQGTVHIDAVRRIPIIHIAPLLGRHQTLRFILAFLI